MDQLLPFGRHNFCVSPSNHMIFVTMDVPKGEIKFFKNAMSKKTTHSEKIFLQPLCFW
jgi:hypothetical protein